MKKFYSLASAVLLCLSTFAQGVTVPFESSIAGKVDGVVRFVDGWTQIDNNNDNSIWAPNTDSGAYSGYCAKYTYNGSNQGDDYLVSPAISFEAGKEYKIVYKYRAQSATYTEDFETYVSKGNTTTEILAGKQLAKHETVGNTSYAQDALDFVPEESGNYYVVIRCTSPKNMYYLYIADFQVVENKFAPSAVSNLTATRGADKALTCTLTWVLPTTDIFGAPLPEDKPIEKVEIFRDGGETVIATLAGDATTFTDTEETGLTSGKHTYTVVITAGGETAAKSVGPTAYVGPVVPTPVPVTMNIGLDDKELWTVVEGENSNGIKWDWNTYSSDPCFRYTHSYSKSEDAWLITPPLSFTEAGAYAISFNVYCGYPANNTCVEGYFGTSTEISSMELRCENLPMFKDRTWSTFYVNVTEPGTYYAALHAAGSASHASSQNYNAYGVMVEKANIMPQAVSQLTAEPVGIENKVKLSFFLSDKSNADTDLTADNVKVNIYSIAADKTETLVKTVSGSDLTLGAVNSVEVPVDEAGIYTFRVCTANAQDDSVPAHPTVTTSWIGDRTVALPYSIDFSLSTVDDTFYVWNVIDANADGNTFERYNYYGMRCNTPTAVDGFQEYNDYLVSPILTLEPGFYMVRYQVSGGSANAEKLDYTIGLAGDGAFTAENLPELLKQKDTFSQDVSFKEATYSFNVETAGRYQIVFKVVGQNPTAPSDYRKLTFKTFSFESCKVLPGIATGLTVVPDADKALKATLTWTNPTTTNIDGLALANDEITKAVILRDGEEVGTVTEGLVPGETSTYVDEELEQAGSHVYAVEIYNINGKSETAATTVTSEWIGNGLQTPYTANSYTTFKDWAVVDANNDATEYSCKWMVQSSKDYASLTSTSRDADDWLVSPIIDIQPKAIYKISVTISQNNSSSYYTYESPMQLWAGLGDDYNTFTRISSFTLSKEAFTSAPQTDVFYVYTTAEELAAAIRKAAETETEGEGEGNADDDIDESKATLIPYGNVHFAIRCIGRADLKVSNFTISYVKESSGEVPQPGEHVCNGQELPYSANLATSSSSFAEGWTIKDNNSDNKTWQPTTDKATSNGFAAYYNYSSANAGDDYLISPLFHFGAGKEYKILYNYRSSSSSYAERLYVYVSESDLPAEIKGSTRVAAHEEIKKTVYEQGVATFTSPVDVDAHVVFLACSDKDKYALYVSDVTIIENQFAPKPVSNITAEVAPLREVKVTLHWDLPTQSIFNDPFTEEQTVEQVEIFRDGGETAIATLLGAVTSFEDTEETGLTAGYHNYKIVVTVAGATAEAEFGPTQYVGPVAPVAVPVTFQPANADEATFWTTIKDETSSVSNSWTYESSYYSGSYYRLGYYGTDVVSDWLITPPIAISEAGYYRVGVSSRCTDGKSPLYGYVGTSLETADFQLCRELPLTRTEKFVYFDFYAPEAGTYYAGIYAGVEAPGEANNFYVTKVSIETTEFVPAPATDFTATGEGETNNVVLQWKNAAVDFAGLDIVPENYKLEIYRGEELIKTFEGTELATDGTFNSYTDEVPAPGLYTYTLKAVSNTGASAPVTVSLTTNWIGSHLVAMPYEINFADDEETIYIWETVDANNDGTTWFDDGFAGKGLSGAKEESLCVYNDYLLSPNFELEPGIYRYSFEIKGGNASSSGNVEIPYIAGVLAAGTFNAEAPEFLASKSGTCYQYSYGPFEEFIFQITEAGTYQIVFGSCGSIAYNYSYTKLNLRTIKLEEYFIYPLAATDITVTPAEDRVLQATVTWTNPTLTNLGSELADGDLVKAVIIRDGEEVGTVTEGLVPGETSSFIDNTLTQAGPHRYSVDIYNASGKNQEASPEVLSEWIGGALTIPYEASTADDFNLWTLVNIDNDFAQWSVYKSTSFEYIHINSSPNPGNDWAITPELEFEENFIYEVTVKHGFYSSYNAYPNQQLQVGICASGNHEDMQNIYTINMDNNATLYYPKTETFTLITAPEDEIATTSLDDFEEPVDEADKIHIGAGSQYLGIYSGAKGEVLIHSFSIAKIGSTTGVDGVFAKDGVVYTNGKLSFEGMADINVYNVAGALVASEYGVNGSYSTDHLANGVYMIAITFENGTTTVLKVVK